ncbi:MAG: electron transfer flavoprotein subunit alpha/FixB family protein [Pseudomonadota bacterium]
MANIHVHIEVVNDRPGEPSLQVLGEGRRIATFLGATLYAVVPSATGLKRDSPLVELLGKHGADRVISATGPELAGPPLFACHGFAMTAVCEQIPAALVLLAATSGGRDVAPRLAARLGAAFFADAAVEYGPHGEVVLSRRAQVGTARRRLAIENLAWPVVATLSPSSCRKSNGGGPVDVIAVPLSQRPPPPFEEARRQPDPSATLETAEVLITAGAGIEVDQLPLLERLANLLGGELAFTEHASRKGLGPIERVVGISGRLVAPRLYVACAASGSSEHLAAVPLDAEIVAINSDPMAPVFGVASYGLVGQTQHVLPGLIAALEQRASERAVSQPPVLKTAEKKVLP